MGSEALFDDLSTGWDDRSTTRGMSELVKSWIVAQKWWNPPLDGPAMDFGCGTGLLTMALLDKLGTNVAGVDMSRGMLAEFEKKAAGKGVTTFPIELTGPGQLGEGADESFALVYTSLVLHHIQDCQSVVTTLAGYLRPGGRMLLFDFEADENAHLFHPPDYEIGNQLEHHGIAEKDLRTWCENTGVLEDIEVDHVPFKKEAGGQGDGFGTGVQFQMLALSCVKKSSPE